MIEVVVSASVAVVGLLWLVWPRRFGIFVPGALILNDRVTAQLGLPRDAWSRIRDAGWIVGPSGDAEARIFGFALVVIGISGLLSHLSAMLVLVAAVVVLYAAVASSASTRASHSAARRDSRLRIDRVTLLALLGPIGSAAILACMPFFTAHCLAVVVAAVVAVIAYVHAVTNLNDAASPLERTLTERWRCGLDFTAITLANLAALAYRAFVLTPGDPFTVALGGWLVVAGALLVYYMRRRFTTLNDTLRSALK